MNKHKFPYEWTLKDAVFTKDKGKVFSCFACGGGSTMGYKLAGFDVIGCNEIDPRMAEAYKTNHNPKYCYIEPIQDFKNRKDLPEDLYNLDILDGSPPCSSFSVAGNREKDWGKEKKFREGQEKQVLDTLFFDFIDLVKELQPKVVIAENVKGLLMGESHQYLSKIYDAYEEAGYKTVYRLLDSLEMGVPQKRERVFFLSVRNDLADLIPKVDLFSEELEIDMNFYEEEIPVEDFVKYEKKKATINYCEDRFGDVILNPRKASPTITSRVRFWEDALNVASLESYSFMGSFPQDYIFNHNNVYIIGMSVPPVMMAQIATRVYDQWFRLFNSEANQ